MSKTPSKNPRNLALTILDRVDQQQAYADVLLSASLDRENLPNADGALLTHLVYGALRWRGRIDWALSNLLRKPLEELDPVIRNLLRLGGYELLFLDRIPAYATVNELVDLARTRTGPGKTRLVNAVLRRLAGQEREAWSPPPASSKIEEVSALVSHPTWLVRLWRKQFGENQSRELMDANNKEAPLVLRTNRRRTNRDELVRRLRSRGIEAKPGIWSPLAVHVHGAASPAKLTEFREGLCQVQGEASQLVSFLVGPEPGMRILDVCAAPGGKTTHMAELMNDNGELLACDVSKRGLDRLRNNARRLGLNSIRASEGDAARSLPGGSEGFDRVLVDAPCSGLGTLRAHPEIRWRRTQKDLGRLAALQGDLLTQAASRVRPGGALVYATCTLSRVENEALVEAFVERHSEFAIEDAASHLPGPARAMTTGHYLLALPHRHDTDGFFAARIRRVAPAQ